MYSQLPLFLVTLYCFIFSILFTRSLATWLFIGTRYSVYCTVHDVYCNKFAASSYIGGPATGERPTSWRISITDWHRLWSKSGQRRIPPPRRIWSRSRDSIRSPDADPDSGRRIRISDPDDFQNLMGTSLFKGTFVIKFSWRSDQFFQVCEPNCGKMLYLAMLKNP